MPDFIVISLKHTQRQHKAITLWRPDDRGYCWTLDRAGRYAEAQVMEHLGYYNTGRDDIAVPLELVEQLACDAEYAHKESGICIPNNAATWKRLLAGVIQPTKYESRPEYRGARYKKAA